MRRALGIGRRIRHCETGSVAVEFAFIAMGMITLSLGLIEFGRGFYMYNKLSQAADLAAREVLKAPVITDDVLRGRIFEAFEDGEKAQLVVGLTPKQTVNGVDFRTVVIKLPFAPLIPGLTSTAINLSITRRLLVLS